VKALKLVLNGSYGAFAAPYFILYNNNVAGTITAEGRELTKSMDRVNEDYWYDMWHLDVETHKKMHIRNVTQIPKNESVSIYGDSVDGKSIIRTESGSFTIEDLYNKYNTQSIRPDKEVIPVNFKSLNWTEERGIHYSSVKNIIRHKTTKKRWKLKAGGKEILVTSDHSLIVFRNGIKIKLKPNEIKSGDKVLLIF
jgi:DNA polymerase elongation subunit (family B)